MFFKAKKPIEVRLYAPENYINASPEARAEVCNGCGTGKFVVPDKILGVPIKEACHIHDWMFTFAEHHYGDKDEADRVFLDNMMRIIFAHGGGVFTMFVRIVLAIIYYQIERHAGGVAFWVDKIEPENILIAEIER